MLTRIALGILMLLAVPAASAASYDCAKASTAFERANYLQMLRSYSTPTG